MRNGVTEQELIDRAKETGGERVTLESINHEMVTGEYIQRGLLTIYIIGMRNGYQIVGKSACADPKNFSEELGRKLAYQDAVNQIWPLMGYELKCRLARAPKPEDMADAVQAERPEGAQRPTGNAEGAGSARQEEEIQPKETFIDRMKAEHVQLLDRFTKLTKFLDSYEFNILPKVDKQDLRNQHYHMEGYKNALDRRLSRAVYD